MNRWWTDRTDAERFDVYTRGSLYSLLVGMIAVSVLFGVGDAPANTAAAVVSVVLLAAATFVGVKVVGRGLDNTLHGAPVPVTALRTYLVLALAAGVAGYVGYGTPAPGHPGTLAGGALIAIHILAVVSPLLPWTMLAGIGIALAVVVGGLAYALGSPPQSVFGAVWAVLFGAAGVIGGFRGSVWMLRIVWELDRSRRIEADLAVAEERLRFSRDLHDVMGRNLSVVAVRSELAAELARRGRVDEAVEEMLGVRGVARDSLREMREVVRGYRGVDLSAELAGARSVLRAAGTTTKVIGDADALPPDVQSILAWVVREGATNVIRHAEPTTCAFRVAVEDDDAVLTITNDGALPVNEGSGSGLAGLSERLAAVGGELIVDDGPDGSFSLTARVPLAVTDREPAGSGLPG